MAQQRGGKAPDLASILINNPFYLGPRGFNRAVPESAVLVQQAVQSRATPAYGDRYLGAPAPPRMTGPAATAQKYLAGQAAPGKSAVSSSEELASAEGKLADWVDEFKRAAADSDPAIFPSPSDDRGFPLMETDAQYANRMLAQQAASMTSGTGGGAPLVGPAVRHPKSYVEPTPKGNTTGLSWNQLNAQRLQAQPSQPAGPITTQPVTPRQSATSPSYQPMGRGPRDILGAWGQRQQGGGGGSEQQSSWRSPGLSR